MNTLTRIPLLAIDLELQMREALFTNLSASALQQDLSMRPDLEQLLFQFAWDIVPKIWPTCEQEARAQLTDVALELPELLTQEPTVVLDPPFFDYQLLPCTPLLLLHANVVHLAIQYGRSDISRLAQLRALTGTARLLYGALRKRYVKQGYHSYRAVSVCEVVKERSPKEDWHMMKHVRTALENLVQVGFVEPFGERYQLTMTECYDLLTRYHLEEKCPPCYRETYACVWKAVQGLE